MNRARVQETIDQMRSAVKLHRDLSLRARGVPIADEQLISDWADALVDALDAPRNTADDIGFDQAGQPIAIGAEAGAASDAIVDHPHATPVLVVARLHDDLGVRVYGPPTALTAALLDELAVTYRKAVEAAMKGAS